MLIVKFRTSFFIVFVLSFGLVTSWAATVKHPSSPLGQITGNVRYSNGGDPAGNVLVRLESFSGGMLNDVRTDRTGKFSFTELAPAQYVVTAHNQGYIDDKRQIDLQTTFGEYVLLTLKPENSNAALTSIGVLDANIPVEAQNEYAKAKLLIDDGKNGKINEAIHHLEKATAISPNYLAAQLMIGIAYMDLRQWEQAEKALRASIKINVNATTAYFALGEVYRREKKYQDAEKILLDGIKLNAASAEGHNTLAKVYWDMAPAEKDDEKFKSDLENSWGEVKKALALKPTLAEAHLLAGNHLLKARRPQDALVHFEEYLKLEPKGAFAADTELLVAKIKQALSQAGKK
jgi:tetratricopeptide (TPR) repeat protein